MDGSLAGYALDWTDASPALVPYVGRLETPLGDDSAIVIRGGRQVVVPHRNIFWFSGLLDDVAACRLHMRVGTA